MKFLFYLLLFIILWRLAGTVIRLLSRPANRSAQTKRPKNSNVNVKEDPKNKSTGYKGGEYIDYEEVD